MFILGLGRNAHISDLECEVGVTSDSLKQMVKPVGKLEAVGKLSDVIAISAGFS